MLNAIWVLMVAGAVVCGALTNRLDEVAKASTESATAAVTLAIGLVGVMALWLGLMRVLHEGGLLHGLARAMRPVMTRLFPDVPAEHPAMSMMILNMTSNMLGLGNAATPFGIKAMMELDKLNPTKGTATNAMALFLAINTSNLALLPTGIIALRASLGSQTAGAIVATTLLATSLSTLVAIVAAKLLATRSTLGAATAAAGAELGPGRAEAALGSGPAHAEEAEPVVVRQPGAASSPQRWCALLLLIAILAALGYAFCRSAQGSAGVAPLGWSGALQHAVNNWVLLLLLGGIVVYGVFRGVKVYDAVVEGGKEGFQVALRIIPFLVAILVGVGMLRASGAIDLMVVALEPVTRLLGMPAETLPMALLRPLSGSGAYGVAAEIMKTHGPDSLVGQIVSTMQGSTETTFYVLAVYFGAVQVRNARHTVAACLIADAAGMLGAVWACRLLLS